MGVNRSLMRTGWMALAAASLQVAAMGAEPLAVTAVRFWSLSDVTRIAVETNGSFDFQSKRLFQPDRMFFDLRGAKTELNNGGTHIIPVNDSRVRQIRIAENQPAIARVVVDFIQGANIDISTSQLSAPNRLMIEVRQKGGVVAPSVSSNVSSNVPSTAAPAETKPQPPKPQAKEFAFRGLTPVAKAPEESLLAAAAPPLVAKPLRAHPAVKAASVPSIDPPPGKHLIRRYQTPSGQPATEVEDEDSSEEAEAAAPAATHIARRADVPPPPVTDPVVREKVMTGAPQPARNDSLGDRSLTRVLGLKVRRVVIDPGHGGADFGTTGPGGLHEKDVALDVSKRLSSLIEERMGSEVIMTRNSDTFIPLETRPQIANSKKADLFVSVHVNSSPMREAGGIETYYLSFTTSRQAMDVAARENAASQRSVHELRDLVQKIALRDKLDESREFAAKVQKALSPVSPAPAAMKNRGVKRAPFVVLIGAQMPAILAEVGFISNGKEESMLKRADYRQKLAEALYRGISQYADSLSHFEVAQGRSTGSE